MKAGLKILIAAFAVATSSLLMAAQAPPPVPAPPQGGPAWGQQGPGFGRGPQWRRGQMGMGRHGMGMRGQGMPMRGMQGRGFRGQRGGLGRMLRNPAMRERLGVTPEQATRIQAQESTFAKSRIQSDAGLRVKRMELDELLAAEKPDRTAIDKKMRELSDARFAAEKSAMDHRLAMRDALTPEQKEKMKQWQQEQRQQWMERRGPGGPGPGPRMRGPRPPQAPQAPAPPVE